MHHLVHYGIQMAQPPAGPETQVTDAVDRAFKHAGVSYRDVASGAGIPLSTLLRRLKRGDWTIPELAAIAEYLDIPVTDFVGSVQ